MLPRPCLLQNVSHSARSTTSRRKSRPRLEPLEGRFLLAASDLPVGTFAVLRATIPVGASSTTVPFTILPGDLARRAAHLPATLELVATATDGGPVQLASTINRMTPRGSKPLSAAPNGPDAIVTSLRPGTHNLMVAGRPGQTVQVAVKLAGDVNGDVRVNRRDLRLIAHALGSREGQPGYSQAAGVRRDGRPLGSFPSDRLAAGVNISSTTADGWEPGGPWDAQAALLIRLTDARSEVAMAGRLTGHYLPDHPETDLLQKQFLEANARLEDLQRTLVHPRPFHFVVRPAASSTQ